MTTDFPTAHNCNYSTRQDEVGSLVWQAIRMADADEFPGRDGDELIACLEHLEETLAESAEDGSEAAGNACRAAEEAVAAALRSTRTWFLDSHRGERLDAPATVEAMGRCQWQGFYPVIDADLDLTGEWCYADNDDEQWTNYDDEAMIDRAAAEAAGWKITEDGYAVPPGANTAAE